MGGVAGHMDHLYDNSDLTFSKMKEIMEAASNGELKTKGGWRKSILVILYF